MVKEKAGEEYCGISKKRKITLKNNHDRYSHLYIDLCICIEKYIFEIIIVCLLDL